MKIGIIGGTGALGSALARAWLDSSTVAAADLILAGRNPEGAWPGPEPVRYLTDLGEVASCCDVIVLSVPPRSVAALNLNLVDKLVLSVMAGVTLKTLEQRTGARRLIRAMSSPAAAHSRAFSPWMAGDGASPSDRRLAQTLLQATGETAELTEESQLDVFTAITGPVPGFVALFAQCLSDYAQAQGVPPQVADKAVRQLFWASGHVLKSTPETPQNQVQAMIEYAGTTAAGMSRILEADLQKTIAQGLDAAVEKAQEFGRQAGSF